MIVYWFRVTGVAAPDFKNKNGEGLEGCFLFLLFVLDFLQNNIQLDIQSVALHLIEQTKLGFEVLTCQNVHL